MSTKQVTCRYFLHGVCREGSQCMFSHDVNNSKPSTICKYYQRGTCAYGERCRYDHVKPSRGGGGGASEGQAGVGRGVRGEGRKPMVLRDRALGSDRAFGGPSERLQSLAPEAAAAPHSYRDAIRTGLDSSVSEPVSNTMGGVYQLCPYAAAGHCYYEDSCPYLHGDLCEVCRLQVLHPHDPEQRKAHEKMCMLAFEADMEKAFAAQLSQGKVCSICMEVVVQKAIPSERRFGILSSCCHTFCLNCIRKWRLTRNFSNKIIKSCPECRIISEFVIPSVYWVEDQEEKDHLIELFKSGVSKKACKYFDQGRGTCPFEGNCLYLHAFPDGRLAEPDRPRKQLSSEGNVRFMNNVRLWDFIEEREQRTVPPMPTLDDDITELRELFMQMSGPSDQEAEAPPDPVQ
ncbi:probable E3 ubiquitin-protein ligase makorin-2 [Cyprinodon tularosa]|uniref:E3 ubiquitin-protein ligase makorin-2 n=1 Tax=Cyprinodon variegatus TaxID=28743 RepID=A0A3Q2D1F6_CYPVA|nr:PREDICTED: probable E3 ubiquitin-protein ligase makorin-2 [Cyprinodon variegatus]XP_038157726.1 probable E3 ubiquitin-protein ligase makorin-2 [Cyprinodon tularosa]